MNARTPVIYTHRDQGLDPKRLAALLFRFSPLFRPPLEEKLDLDEYAGKLLSNAEILLAVAEGAVVGFLAIYANDLVNRRAHIPLLAVLPSHQGRGLGRALLADAIALAGARGMRSISLEYVPGNDRAQLLYESCGFHAVGPEGPKVAMQYDIDPPSSVRGTACGG